MAGKAFEWLDICVYAWSVLQRPLVGVQHTSQNMPFQMFIPGEGMSTICAENHGFGE